MLEEGHDDWKGKFKVLVSYELMKATDALNRALHGLDLAAEAERNNTYSLDQLRRAVGYATHAYCMIRTQRYPPADTEPGVDAAKVYLDAVDKSILKLEKGEAVVPKPDAKPKPKP
jgi:hypothetical protein